ncbi:MAG TPA: response regulator [Actinomycetota bacterium]|nr:response regulator [Actinomycetota bacterium]
MTVRLLVVDDTDHVRRMLVEILSMHGFDVAAQAADGAEAVEEARRAEPDIVVMDYKMPGTDGLEATRLIRAERPDQTVILYSAYLDEKLRARAREAGVSACVAKRSGVEALATEISALAMDIRGEGEPSSTGQS